MLLGITHYEILCALSQLSSVKAVLAKLYVLFCLYIGCCRYEGDGIRLCGDKRRSRARRDGSV